MNGPPGTPGQERIALFTIGHSNHELPALVALLAQHGVKAVADVRSQPYSRHHPQFNRETLAAALRQAGLGYVFLGEELGARRAEAECYVNGKARYERIAQAPRFRQGLERVRQGARAQRVALLCAEKDPLTCHRAILVCRRLRGPEWAIAHILHDGTIEPHERAEERLLEECKLPAGSLFESKEELIEQAYDRRGEKIAYVEGSEGDPPDVAPEAPGGEEPG